MNNTDLSPIIDKVFSTEEMNKARRLISEHRVSLSFSKGAPERFFTGSGIVRDEKTYQVSTSIKKNELSSHCQCPYQKSQSHCYHAAALLLMASSQSMAQTSQTGSGVSVSLDLQSQGVYPREYGTFIKAPSELEGAGSRAVTFNQLQYIIDQKKIINFPVLSQFDEQKIKLIIKPSQKEGLFDIKVALEQDGETNEKVSFFSALYLFDWKNGKAYELSTTHQFLFRYLTNHSTLQPIGNYLLRLAPLFDHPLFKIELEDTQIALDDFDQAKPAININVHSKNELDVNLFFLDSNSRRVSLPHFFKLFCFDNGYLGEMRSKKFAYDFIEKLIVAQGKQQNTFVSQLPDLLKVLVGHWIQAFLDGKTIPHYDHNLNQFYHFESEYFKEIFSTLMTYLASDFIRVSQFSSEKKQLSFRVSKSKVMEILHALNDTLRRLEIPLTFNEKKITTWKPGIQFKRNFSNINWLDLSYDISKEDQVALKHFRKNMRTFVNDDGELVLVDNEGAQVAKLLSYLTAEGSKEESDGTDEKYTLKFSRSRIFELFEIYRLNLGDLLTTEEKEICEKLSNLEEVPEYSLSDNFGKIARDYQKRGHHWLRFLYENKLGACLSDEMGLGKTLQTLMFIDGLYDEVKNILIVAPVSIISNWVSEINHFTDLPVNVYYGEGRTLKDKDENTKISITSYGVLKREFHDALGEMEWDIVVFDEIQKLKNASSLGAHAARNLNSKFRLALTGTPVENHFGEFHNIIDLTLPGIWGERFWRKHQSQEDLSLAKKIVRPFILRRTKKQVLSELPDKVETPVLLNLSEDEQAFYTNNLLAIKDAMTNDKSIQQFNILQFILKLRQLCLWQSHNGGAIHSTKIDFLVDNLKQIHEEGHKALIFSQFTSYLDLIQSRLHDQGWKISRIDGSLSLKKRDQELEKFQNDESDFFLISLKAGGFGLNLTKANYIFLMDPWWNPAVENQAIDRAHRIGQTKNVIVYRPIIKDSIEEKVLLLQEKKKQLFTDLMGSDEDSIYDGRLNKNDFIELLS